ncbi:MAG: hypothetical protein GC154_17535 [bacterium]|nr:hypothetical protein [bacterium]
MNHHGHHHSHDPGHHHHDRSHTHSHGGASHYAEAAHKRFTRVECGGLLETLAARLCEIAASHHPSAEPRALLHFAEPDVPAAEPCIISALADRARLHRQSIPLGAFSTQDDAPSLKEVRGVMRIGADAAAEAMRGGSRLLIVSCSGKELAERALEASEATLANQTGGAAILARSRSTALTAMTGAIVQAGCHHTAILLDGIPALTAMALAASLDPSTANAAILACVETNPLTEALVQRLNLTPILRAGHAAPVNAILALPMIDAAIHVYEQLA